jgi:hypothetical protein
MIYREPLGDMIFFSSESFKNFLKSPFGELIFSGIIGDALKTSIEYTVRGGAKMYRKFSLFYGRSKSLTPSLCARTNNLVS